MEFTFVAPELEAVDLSHNQPASYLRKTFHAEGIKKAELKITAFGVYKAYVNGHALDDALLLPGFTDYRRRVQYQSYDVTPYLVEGENVVAAVIGEGWYRGSCGAGSTKGYYGKQIALAASLELTDAKGARTIATDTSWKATQEGPIRENDLKTYETYDATMEMNGWTEPGYDDSAWHGVLSLSYAGTCVPHEGAFVHEHESFEPTVLTTPNGETVLDFGQNLAGHVEFTVTGMAGHQVVLIMGETLDENGNFTLKNVSETAGTDDFGTLGQRLTYVLKDGTQTYRSFSLISGYRYVRLQNWPEEVRPENFRSKAVYSDLTPTGRFSSSSAQLDQLVKNVQWSQKSNFVEIPTDCPTRERAGWTGDINVFSEMACWLTDTRQFLHKWLRDFAGMQRDNGSLPFIVPEIDMDILPNVNMTELPYSSAGWSDAFIHVPMVLYRFYGDREALELVYEGAKRFLDFDFARAQENHPDNADRTEEHYRYVLDTGFHWGEWSEPGTVMFEDMMQAMTKPDSEVATAWLFHSTKELSEMAQILGHEEDAAHYAELAEKVRDAYRKEFLPEGTVNSPRQCKYVRPLMMGLVEGEEAKAVAAALNDLVMANDYKVGTGFLTTFRVLHTLAENGYAETAYKMLFNEGRPGWMYELSKGATTTWENWNGINDEGVPENSLNHYSPGAALSFVFEYIGGIKPLASGFAKVQVKPLVSNCLEHARAEHDTPQGTIVSAWKREDDGCHFHVETPEGVETTVILPDGTNDTFAGGVRDYVA